MQIESHKTDNDTNTSAWWETHLKKTEDNKFI